LQKEEIRQEALQKIIDCALSENDKAAFGEKVAEILAEYGLIDTSVYEILKGSY